MKLLADENIDRPIVEKLISGSLDIKSVDDLSKGISDEKVLQIAKNEERILITFDRDFSDVEAEHPGIIRLTSPAEHNIIVEMVRDLLNSFTKQDFKNTVVEVSPGSYRNK